MIPVLQQFDNAKDPVGYVSFENGSCVVRFKEFKTQKDIFNIFGRIGLNAIDSDDKGNIKTFIIHCWSVR